MAVRRLAPADIQPKSFVFTPENLAKLDHYKEVSQRLANPRNLSPEEAERLIGDEKLLVAVSCPIHASEVAATRAR